MIDGRKDGRDTDRNVSERGEMRHRQRKAYINGRRNYLSNKCGEFLSECIALTFRDEWVEMMGHRTEIQHAGWRWQEKVRVNTQHAAGEHPD